uniref:Hypotheticial protein n=1 Tax=Schistosoma japonicum TaxID=6182 RepID=C7TXQ6_SCHJA|nr:hypotheticial protein [Schistosoma japonicum]
MRFLQNNRMDSSRILLCCAEGYYWSICIAFTFASTGVTNTMNRTITKRKLCAPFNT